MRRADFTKNKHKIEDTAKALKQCYAQVAAAPGGIEVLQHLMTQCGYQDASITFNLDTGEAHYHNTIYNEARRNIWLTTRQYIPHDKLILIELPEPPQEDQNDE